MAVASPLCRQSKETARTGGLLPLNTSGFQKLGKHFISVHFEFRFQLRFYYSPHPHMLPVTPTFPKLLQGTLRYKSQFISREDSFIADFRLRFQISADSSGERNRNRGFDTFDFRFQVSDSREGQKSKSRLRFQVSGFRLSQGEKLKS